MPVCLAVNVNTAGADAPQIQIGASEIDLAQVDVGKRQERR